MALGFDDDDEVHEDEGLALWRTLLFYHTSRYRNRKFFNYSTLNVMTRSYNRLVCNNVNVDREELMNRISCSREVREGFDGTRKALQEFEHCRDFLALDRYKL